jgi:hypothetical protein
MHCNYTRKNLTEDNVQDMFAPLVPSCWRNISNTTLKIGLDFKSSHFDPVLGFASGLIKLRGLEI